MKSKKVPKKRTPCILFIVEKIFNIELKFNQQNDHLYANSCYETNDKIPRFRGVITPYW